MGVSKIVFFGAYLRPGRDTNSPMQALGYLRQACFTASQRVHFLLRAPLCCLRMMTQRDIDDMVMTRSDIATGGARLWLWALQPPRGYSLAASTRSCVRLARAIRLRVQHVRAPMCGSWRTG